MKYLVVFLQSVKFQMIYFRRRFFGFEMFIHTFLLSIQFMTVLISQTSERIHRKNNV